MINILIVDDDIVDYEMVRRLLLKSDLDTEITHATNVDDGIAQFKAGDFDVVLLDYRMPQRDGIEMVLELRALPKAKSSAIIMMSASDDEQLALDCIKAGAQDFITKSDVTLNTLRRSMLRSCAKFELELELDQSYQRIKQLAESDGLTGLANRYFFDQTLRMDLLTNQRSGEKLALLLFDLDDFKTINDTHGHAIGDELLKQLTVRIRKTLRGNELFSRLGGDEFAIVLTGLKEAAHANVVARRIMAVFDNPFEIDTKQLRSSISMGIAISPDNAESPEELLKHADIAMYRAKKQGRRQICFFEKEMQEHIAQRYSIETELREAIRQQDQFLLHFQPIYEMQRRVIVGFEALIRWQVAGQLRPPDTFIPIAEETRLINEIGRWVIRSGLEHIAKWNKQSQSNYSISINLSAVQLSDAGLVDYVDQCLKKLSLNADVVEFELTETALIQNRKDYHDTIYQLAEMGCTIALDDFGVGFSSISHLQNFPIKTLKIDRSILPDATSDKKATNLFRSLISMGNMLELHTVAEGVESEDHLNLCQQLGVERAQGYFLGRPQPSTDIEKHYLND